MDSLIQSYLNRRAYVREGDQLVLIKKKFGERSAPQGSLLSPLMWRYFDGLFSRLYTNSLLEIMKRCEYLVDFEHVSYADDHLTVVLVKWNIFDLDYAARIDALVYTVQLQTSSGSSD